MQTFCTTPHYTEMSSHPDSVYVGAPSLPLLKCIFLGVCVFMCVTGILFPARNLWLWEKKKKGKKLPFKEEPNPIKGLIQLQER